MRRIVGRVGCRHFFIDGRTRRWGTDMQTANDKRIDSVDRFRTKFYSKIHDFTFSIMTLPLIWSNIPATPTKVYISQLIFQNCCCLFGLLLTWKQLMKLELLVAKLKTSFRKFYCRHNYLGNHYGMYVSQVYNGYDPLVIVTIPSVIRRSSRIIRTHTFEYILTYHRIWFIPGLWTWVTIQVSILQQKLLTS